MLRNSEEGRDESLSNSGALLSRWNIQSIKLSTAMQPTIATTGTPLFTNSLTKPAQDLAKPEDFKGCSSRDNTAAKPKQEAPAARNIREAPWTLVLLS